MKQECVICKNKDVKIIYTQFPGYIEDTFFDIYECNNCKSHFILSPENLSDIYEKIYSVNSLPGYDRYFNYARKIKNVADPLKYLAYEEAVYFPVYDYLRRKKGKLKILEIGCGYGYLTYAIKKRGMDILGIDISGEAIKYAQTHFGDFYLKSDLESLDCKEEKFDLIIATELIEHLPHPNRFLTKCKELLDEKGLILLTTPSKEYYPSNHIWNTDRPPVHVTWFTHYAFENMALANSMKIVYADFSKYYPPNENRLIKYLRTRKENPGVTKLSKKGTPLLMDQPKEKSLPHKLFAGILHRFFLIRFPCNMIYNFISGKENTMGIILYKEI